MKRLALVAAALLALAGVWSTTAYANSGPKFTPHTHSPPERCTIEGFRPFSAAVWRLGAWERGLPPNRVLEARTRALACAASPSHRSAMKRTWRRDAARYFAYRHGMLARDINHRYPAHWAPDFSGETLPFNVAAALFEAAGMPGVTMAQVAKGESGLRPGSAGVDPGGTVGYGTLAVTSPFADSIVGRLGGYNEMLNPVKNAAAAAEIYHSNGLGAWYGTGYVTGTNLHYHGHLDLRRYLGGLTFRQALRH